MFCLPGLCSNCEQRRPGQTRSSLCLLLVILNKNLTLFDQAKPLFVVTNSEQRTWLFLIRFFCSLLVTANNPNLSSEKKMFTFRNILKHYLLFDFIILFCLSSSNFYLHSKIPRSRLINPSFFTIFTCISLVWTSISGKKKVLYELSPKSYLEKQFL